MQTTDNLRRLIWIDQATTRRLVVGFRWNLVAAVFNQGSTFVSAVLLARTLTPLAFGHFAVILSTVTSAATLLSAYMGSTTAKYLAQYRTEDPGKAGRIIVVCGIFVLTITAAGSAGLVFEARWFAVTLLHASELQKPLEICAAFVLFAPLHWLLAGILTGLEAFRTIGKSAIAGGILTTLAVVIGARSYGISGAAYGLAGGAVAKCIIHLAVCLPALRRQRVPVRIRDSSEELPVLYHFALPGAVASYFSLLAIWTAQAFAARQSNGYHDLALFSAANTLRLLIVFVPQVLNSVLLALLNSALPSRDTDQFRRLFRFSVALLTSISIVLAVLVGAVASLPATLFGASYGSALWPLRILLLSTVSECLTLALTQYFTAHEKIWNSLFAVNLPREGAFLLLTMLLVPRFGASGMAGAYLAGSVLGLIGVLLLLEHYRRSPPERHFHPAPVAQTL